MNFKNTFIAASTALVIAGTSLTAPTTASAAPFVSFKSAQLETEAAGVEEVGRRGRRWRRHHRRHRRFNHGAAAASGIGAFALGAAIAAGAHARPYCRTVRVERWSRRHQAYVIRHRRVCD